MFHFTEIAPGVKHIQDAMGVCFTLIEGEQGAVLFDTGYGTEDVQAYVKTLTDKPVKSALLLSLWQYFRTPSTFTQRECCQLGNRNGSQSITMRFVLSAESPLWLFVTTASRRC